jgi:hypothetical protein
LLEKFCTIITSYLPLICIFYHDLVI